MTNHYEIEMQFHAASPEAFEDFLDCVLDELEKIGITADMAASLSNLTATFAIEVDDLSESSLISAMGDVRTALHAARCATVGWPSRHEVLSARSIPAENLALA